ncbi:MAG TPA: SDR family oxidoreductase [Longimicrobiales bacterium]|jgi:NAD(P)-dependent dehydrogenase (short-subunit alcohol dehydrogenase family)
MPDLKGRVALVSGGSKGIGRAIARRLAGAGASVVVSARTNADVQKTAEELGRDAPADVIGIPCDVRRPDNCAELVERTVERLGGLDILINNAGIGVFKSIREMTGEEWRRQIDTNLGGVFYLSQAAVPHLLGSDFAWIINVGSLASRNTFAGGTGYNASKFGLLGMTEAMMLDLRHDGIRVSIVMPGSVDTDFGQRGIERPWALKADDVALAVMQLMEYPPNAHVSRMEMRPARPEKG